MASRVEDWERLVRLDERLAMLPPRFRWTLHNLVAHPASEVLFQLGFERAGNWIHDVTVPAHERGTGRG